MDAGVRGGLQLSGAQDLAGVQGASMGDAVGAAQLALLGRNQNAVGQNYAQAATGLAGQAGTAANEEQITYNDLVSAQREGAASRGHDQQQSQLSLDQRLREIQLMKWLGGQQQQAQSTAAAFKAAGSIAGGLSGGMS